MGTNTQTCIKSYIINGKWRWCQTKANSSPEPAIDPGSGCELTPFGQGDGAVLLERFSPVQIALVTEMIVNG